MFSSCAVKHKIKNLQQNKCMFLFLGSSSTRSTHFKMFSHLSMHVEQKEVKTSIFRVIFEYRYSDSRSIYHNRKMFIPASLQQSLQTEKQKRKLTSKFLLNTDKTMIKVLFLFYSCRKTNFPQFGNPVQKKISLQSS